MSRPIILIDANIFYSAPLRDLFVQVATKGLFQARWTASIHQEWIEALLRNQPQRIRQTLERTRGLIDGTVRDCLITGYEPLIPTLILPDPNDRHVLAAAITGQCTVIVTKNLHDFPTAVLKLYGLQAQHPDSFLHNYLQREPAIFCDTVHAIRGRLRKPAYSATDYLKILSQQDLTATAAELERYVHLI